MCMHFDKTMVLVELEDSYGHQTGKKQPGREKTRYIMKQTLCQVYKHNSFEIACKIYGLRYRVSL